MPLWLNKITNFVGWWGHVGCAQSTSVPGSLMDLVQNIRKKLYDFKLRAEAKKRESPETLQRTLTAKHLYHLAQSSQEPLDQEYAMEIKETSKVKKKQRKMLLLSISERTSHWKYIKQHYLILDTRVVLQHIGLLEASPFGTNLIVPQTVLDEVPHFSLPIFNRLKSFISKANPTGKFIRGWIFWNKIWANYEKATQQYIHTSTTKEYFEKMEEESSKALLNLVASSGSAFKSDGPKHAGEGQI
ncbi:hypothetical protein VP01_1395g4 [Puccinia sorghi]|uniref:PIN domain-containing protein n=1 Tax=Puccinia sorghi TaxID=27349 RepID=A0A0L6VL31_9BASI|nr:hypothetical protein VP01_1395g4 [Puccinia sorghi]